jgi:hypothetical protein
MPNGDDASWIRVCAAIDGFRIRYGQWPKRVRLFPGALEGIRDHVLTTPGFAVVTSVIDLVPDDSAPMIAEGDEGDSYNYGKQGFPDPGPDTSARAWFGEAILRPELRDFD